MLDFETCQRLKDKGFPQEFEEGDYGYAERELKGVHGWRDYKKGDTDMFDGTGEYGCGDSEDGFVLVPRLERLLQELGEKREDEGLILVFDRQWFAGYSRYFDCGYPEPHRYGSPHGKGDTPEQALASLWLSLHPTP